MQPWFFAPRLVFLPDPRAGAPTLADIMECSLFSISYAGLWGQARLTLPEFIAKAAQLGYPAVMLAGKRPHLSPLDCSEEFILQVRDLLAAHRVRCAVVAGYTDFSDPLAAEVPYTEMQLAYVEQLARVARRLGAPVVRLFTAYERHSSNLAAHWDRTIGILREASDRARAFEVTLAVQNHHDLAVHTDAMLELISEVDRPNCRLGFDAWSPALRGEDLYQSAKRAAPYTIITTNADYLRLPRFAYRPDLVNYEPVKPDLVRAVRFGGGFIDFESFFRGLRDGGFDGIANYEMCSSVRGGGSLENLDGCARAYAQWMRQRGFA
jgi:sugar phosphate isomerase/epimerase